MKHTKRHIIQLISILVILSTLLPACQLGSRGAAPTSGPAATEGAGQAEGNATTQAGAAVVARAEPLPPQVIQVTPAPGEEQPLDAALQVIFDQPMDTRSVQTAFNIQPAVSGDFEWPFPHVMRFKPMGKGFERSERYTVTVGEEARSQAGLPLREPVEFRFSTVGFLEVAAAQPADGTEEIATDATVTVLFNRPVVPLAAIEDQANLPQPLTFVPPVRGKGEWLNTSIYAFTPEEGFEPATTYKARIGAGLGDTTGGMLADDYTWEFTTLVPAVAASSPGADTLYVSNQPTIQVAFNQPMDHESAEAAFELKNLSSGEIIEGTFEWAQEGLEQPPVTEGEMGPYQGTWSEGEGPPKVGVETMSFTPDQPLEFATRYQASMAKGATAAKGQAGTASIYKWTFETIEYPRIVSTFPADGDEQADPWGGLEVTFSSPMDPESINGNFTIRPSVAATQVFTYWWESDTRLNISFPIRASSQYQVTFDGDIRGRYGHELGEASTIRWTTRASDPMIYLHSPYRLGTYSAYTQTMAYVTVRNVGQVNFALYKMPLREFLRANNENFWEYWEGYDGQEENLIREWSLDVSPQLNQSLIYGTNLAGEEVEGQDLPGLAPGLYYLRVSVDDEDVYPEAKGYGWLPPQKEMLIVSRHNLTLKTTATEAMVWATDLRSGQELPNLPVVVMDQSGKVLSEGRTDRQGILLGDEHRRLDPWQPVFGFVGDPDNPGEDFAATINQWSDGISPWEFNVMVEDYVQPVAAYLFTDRAIYRPGQSVYFKGILREDDDAHYSLPTGNANVNFIIYDPQGTKVFEDRLSINDLGTVNGEFSLGEEAALGFYSIEANYKDQYFSAGFQVAEYRRPEFEVTVETDKPEYVQGDEIQVAATATYFFGGPVANAQVRYSVLSADHAFNYQGSGWWDFTDYDVSRYRPGEFGNFGELIADGTGTTDEQGRFTFSADADIAQYIASQLFTLEVTVTDVNNQEVSNRKEAIVHKGLFYIGLRPERYVGKVGEENSANVITVDWNSEPSPNRELTVVFSEHNWYSVRRQAEDGQFYWESAVEDVPVFTTTVTTDDEGKGVVSFTPEKGGIYKVSASGQDENENLVRSATYMWISGEEFVNWRQENNDRIDLVADQRQYQVGDTATVLIPHPYQGPVRALITVERGHIYQHWVQTLETNSEQIEIPITEDLIPNVFVSVVIVKGEDETNPVSSFKIGYAALPIETTEKELNVKLTPDKAADEHYLPGETITYEVEVTDSQGEPVQAELALNLVDLSVISLADQQGPSMVGYFWRERGLGVRTASGMTLSVNRINLAVAPEAKGGGGGFGEEFGVVRQRFPDTAYWNPTLRTDENGRGTVRVELPDNLTTWRMGARGVTAETLVGESRVDVVSTKDLLVRPVAPRFFVVGDEAELAAVVHNNTERGLDVEVAFEAEGLQISGSTRQQVNIPAKDNVKVTWQVSAQDTTSVTLRFGARAVGQTTELLPSSSSQVHDLAGGSVTRQEQGGRGGVAAPLPQGLADAVEIPLPVYRYSTPEVVATSGQFAEDGQRIEAVVLPPSFDPTQGELTVQVDPSLAASTVEGLEYLKHFPYECTEQTVSRFLPNVTTYRAFQQLDLADVRPDLETALPQLVGVGLQRLYNQQHFDGGWGWWVTDKSDPFLTAYVLLGMVEAQDGGFVVDEAVMERAVDFLQGSLVRPKDMEKHWQANRQAFILYVLAEAGEGDLGRTVTLFEQRQTLDTFGKAYLAMALDLVQPDEPERVNTLLSDISSEAIVSATGAHWEEEQVDYYAMNTDTRSTAIVLAALARLDPDNALAPNVVRWLMSAREEGIWETTQENAWAIIALTDWMAATKELEGAYNWQVAINGQALGEGSVARENVDETVKLQIEVAQLLTDEANRVIIERFPAQGQGEGSGRLYYSMYLRYFKPVAEVTALNRGIVVSRQYTLADCELENERIANQESGNQDVMQACKAIDEARVGDVIQVKLTIIAPNDLHYVVVEDPFPAGAEGVDQSLKTTTVVGEPPELTRTDQVNPWSGEYGWWWFSHSELRDEKAVLFATYLPAGTYEYTYLIRASLPGEFNVIPTNAYQMYFPEVFGRGDGGVFTIAE